MKKALSIFLFACFAIYHFGYYAFYFSYDHHLESKWEEKIYGESSLKAQQTLIEIPLSAPYMANQDEFQPTNTSFEKNGKFYRAIKQRYQNDTLQVIVVPDTARGVLDNTVKKWISSLVADELPDGKNDKTSVKLLVKDYIQPVKHVVEFRDIISENDSPEFISSGYTNPFFKLACPPPRVG